MTRQRPQTILNAARALEARGVSPAEAEAALLAFDNKLGKMRLTHPVAGEVRSYDEITPGQHRARETYAEHLGVLAPFQECFVHVTNTGTDRVSSGRRYIDWFLAYPVTSESLEQFRLLRIRRWIAQLRTAARLLAPDSLELHTSRSGQEAPQESELVAAPKTGIRMATKQLVAPPSAESKLLGPSEAELRAMVQLHAPERTTAEQRPEPTQATSTLLVPPAATVEQTSEGKPVETESEGSSAPDGRLLIGWNTILHCLGIDYDRKNRVRLRRMTLKWNGPITWVGNKPKVYSGPLLRWIQDLDPKRKDDVVMGGTDVGAELNHPAEMKKLGFQPKVRPNNPGSFTREIDRIP